MGVYLYGSGSTTGLRPGSDIDLLGLTRRSVTSAELISLVSMLLGVSGWSGHQSQFPEVANRRLLEVTSVVVDDSHPSTAKPRRVADDQSSLKVSRGLTAMFGGNPSAFLP